jgi:putative phosphoribosyl transferase
VIVLGLPRGGVPVASEIAQALGLPLDVFVVRKLGVPGQEELALGAIASGGTRVLNRQVVESLAIPPEWIEAVDAKEMRELERREHTYRGDLPPPEVAGRTVILVDDGTPFYSRIWRSIGGSLFELIRLPLGLALNCDGFASPVQTRAAHFRLPQPFRCYGPKTAG